MTKVAYETVFPGRHQIGTVGAITSERWAASDWNTRAASSEYAAPCDARRSIASVAVAAGPNEAVGPGFVGFDQGGVDRGGEAGVVQLDREVFAALAGGLLTGGPELRFMRSSA
jgi:hypothetical protein